MSTHQFAMLASIDQGHQPRSPTQKRFIGLPAASLQPQLTCPQEVHETASFPMTLPLKLLGIECFSLMEIVLFFFKKKSNFKEGLPVYLKHISATFPPE